MQSYLNHSGTGGTNAILAAGGAIASGQAGIGMVLKTAGLGYGFAKWLARPSKGRQLTQFSNTMYNAVAGHAAAPAIKLAIVQMAKSIADDTGRDPNIVAAKIASGLFFPPAAQRPAMQQ